jgi:hypothetical protein
MAKHIRFPNDMPLSEKLERRMNKNGPNGCWIWTAGTIIKGYGRVRHAKKLWLAHRASWLVAHGPIPDGKFVLHRCDNPPCCNPDHLFLGDHAINDADKRAKGRQPSMKGTRNPNVRHTPDKILAIRADPRPVREIADELGCHPSYVYYIKKRKLWASLP